MTAVPTSAAQVQAQLSGELALPSRLGYTLLLLVSLAMAGAISSLLLTEVGLPRRTIVAFVVLLLIALSWLALSAWVLLRRRVLYVRHRIVASRMAVTFSTVLLLGSIAVSQSDAAGHAWMGGAAVGVMMLVIALGMLRRAHAHVKALEARRAELQASLRQ